MRPAARSVPNVMSIDVEDYFQVSAFDAVVQRSAWGDYESRVVPNTQRLLDLFDEFEARSTFFVLGWVGERFPELVKRIVARGHEIASHGYAHQLVYTQTPDAFREDVRRAKMILEDAGGSPVLGYRAPSFSLTRKSLWALDVLAEEGYRYDASIYPIVHDRYGIPDATRAPHRLPAAGGSIVEIPGSTIRVAGRNLPVAGGGYFRLLPYWWTRWGIERINRVERRPAVFYLHPWEIDPAQPRIPIGRISAYRHYRNLARTEARLRRLMETFRFDTVRNVFADLLALPRMRENDDLAHASVAAGR